MVAIAAGVMGAIAAGVMVAIAAGVMGAIAGRCYGRQQRSARYYQSGEYGGPCTCMRNLISPGAAVLSRRTLDTRTRRTDITEPGTTQRP